ncbi:MAG: protein-L-isoaspartate(D-aspartate) O-methyltransferase [Proteobacteria bacterium]|nr:protein-L-isoaspartate(D-aspartate) O-methyltransferase [Pseudomonadota bacterium]
MRWLIKLIGVGKLAALAILVAARVAGPAAHAEAINEHAGERAEMVRMVEAHARGLPNILDAGSIATKVLDVMGEVERHLFVPEPKRAIAYADRPVSIGYGQTISQPFIVALMTQLLETEAGDVVLEIGTGSGYQAAVLAPLVTRVCTIEIISGLGRRAAALLADLGLENVHTKIADGYHGWPECGPFDGIIVTAAVDHVPPPLVAQLKPGGRMVIPVGGAFAVQHLTMIEKTASGQVRTRQLLPVRFVPFTGAKQ